MAAAKIRILDAGSLASLNALPLSVYIVDYNTPVRNIWANSKCLEVHGISLETFCSLVSICIQHLPDLLSASCAHLEDAPQNFLISVHHL